MSPHLQVLLDYVDNNKHNNIPQHIKKLNVSNSYHRSLLFDYYNNTITKLMASLYDISEKNDLANSLLKRAIISMLRCNFYASLEDAYQSIGLGPYVPESYLCAGQVLVSLAKYNDAVDIYDRGLLVLSTPPASALPSLDSNGKNNDQSAYQQNYQQLLINLKQEALLQVDCTTPMGILMKKLPIELLHLIFTEYLSLQDRLVCARVCPAWRAFVLDQIPSMGHIMELEDMPESAMERLVTVRKNGASSDGMSKNTIHKLTLQFDDYDSFVSKSLKSKAYGLLLENNYKYIEIFELRGDPNDVLSSKKKKMCQYLQACGENLKEVVLYENLCPLLISEILTSCPNITRISSTTEESTSRTRLMHHRTQQYKNNSNDRTGRSNKFTDMKRMEYITRSHFTKVYDDYAERGSVIGDNDLKRMNDCKSLVYLEIVGLPIPAFRAPFWQKLRHLQHLILGEPRTPRLLDDVQVKLLHAIDIYCPNLITLRCGYHFKDRAVLPLSPSSSHSNNTNATNKKEKNGLKEITLRTMFYRKNMICKPCLGIESITSMIQRSYHMLQVLHLPIEVFNILVIETISKTIRTLSLLYELGLYTDRTPYYRNNGQGYNDNNVLKPQETRMLIQCCPLLKTIVLKVPTSNGSLLELSKLHQLQRIYFIDSIDEYFFPAVVREQQHLREGRGGDNDEKPTITHADLFFAHCTTLQQVTVRGSFFTDQDLFQLIVNNSELTLLSLHGCDQLTTHGITTALQQLTTTKNRLRSFTFVKLYADINFYEIMVALPNSIASIICVVTVPDDAMQTPHYIHDSLEQVMQTKSNNDDSFCPTVRVLFQNNKVHDNTRPNMLVFHCIPGKGIKEERKDGFEADLLRRRMFADIL